MRGAEPLCAAVPPPLTGPVVPQGGNVFAALIQDQSEDEQEEEKRPSKPAKPEKNQINKVRGVSQPVTPSPVSTSWSYWRHLQLSH